MDNRREIDNVDDEALRSPFSRVYLCPETEQIINCAMGLGHPIEVDALKKAFSNPVILKHPRFCSLMVRDHNGRDHWKKTQVNIDDHIIIHHPPAATEGGSGPEDGGEEAAVNDFLADVAVSTPLSMSKPLWEVHVLMGLNCVVLRVHHALGDGASLMSMLWACFGKKKDFEGVNNGDNNNHDHNVITKTKDHDNEKNKKWRMKEGVWCFIKSLWFTLVFGLRLLGKLLWVKDDKSVIYGGDGVELWPRKLVTVKFKLEDFKAIKKSIPNATVNDVLLGVVSSGISKYLDIKSPKALLQSLQLTGIVVVNLRKGPGLQEMSELMKTGPGSLSSWGNKTGLVIQPVHCSKGVHSLEHVRVMKSIMDQKKQTYEAYLPHIFLKLSTFLFGPKVASWCCHQMLCNTTMLISNIMGPSEEMAIAGNPITYMRVNISSQPQAMTLHMVSYAGRADLQVMVAKDIISDPPLLAKCFEEALLEMKNCNNDELV